MKKQVITGLSATLAAGYLIRSGTRLPASINYASAGSYTPRQHADFIRAEFVQWGEVARVAKVKPD